MNFSISKAQKKKKIVLKKVKNNIKIRQQRASPLKKKIINTKGSR